MQFSISQLLLAFGGCAMASPGTLLGYSYLPPPGFLTANLIQHIASQLESELLSILRTGDSPYGIFEPNLTSISMQLSSAVDGISLFDFNLTSHALNDTSKVDENSVFRIGSVSKLLTVYVFLLQDGYRYWDPPITDFVPELRAAATSSRGTSSIDEVRWENVTLGSLCSQMSGIPRDDTEADLSGLDFPWTQLGLPSLNALEIPTCGSNASQPPCSRSEYLKGLTKRSPVFSPYSTPVYSNAAFRILSYAMENITGMSYERLMIQSVFDPLNLTHTSLSPPVNGGVIPKGVSMWNYNLGEDAATGGLYSSISDLTKLATAILRSQQLEAEMTRRWLKPQAHTSSLLFSVGAPWEIWRTRSNITSGRVVDLYTKSGSIGAYNSLTILIPDYQLVNAIAALAMEAYLPILEQASRTEECRRICGDYISQSGGNSLLSVVMDTDYGLRVSRWISNGSNFLESAQKYSQSTGGGNLTSVRLVPTNLVTSGPNGTGTAYRAIFETDDGSAQPRIFFLGQNAWDAVDQLIYGGVSLDELVFKFDENGAAESVEAKGLRSTMHRT